MTGVTGQVAEPLACALARDNEVFGAARFNDAEARRRLEDAGVRCVVVDLLDRSPSALPADADYVLNFAVTKTNDWDVDLRANSGGLAWLMEHHRNARAFLHCSSTAVDKPMGHHVFADRGPLGDNHGVWPLTDLQHLQDRGRDDRPLGGRSASSSPRSSPDCRCPTGTVAAGRPCICT